jgi:hypothetical protein
MGVPVRQVPGDWVYWGYGSKMAGSDDIIPLPQYVFSHNIFFPTTYFFSMTYFFPQHKK